MNRLKFLLIFIMLFPAGLSAQPETVSHVNATVGGYRGIWFTLGQFSEYGDKYSGGLGTYTMKHIPMAETQSIITSKYPASAFLYVATST